MEENRKRVDDVLKEIYWPKFHKPDPSKDFGMYNQIDKAFSGLSEHLDELRRNQGRLGYASQNALSDLSKAYIEAAQHGDEEEMAYIGRSMQQLAESFQGASVSGELAETGNRFSRTIWQEQMEAELFGRIWQVVIAKTDEVPELTPWTNFKGNIQAFLYGYLDVVSELAKALDEELSKPDMTSKLEFALFERYLAIAKSITLRLSYERHVPGYVINNGYGLWMAYTKKIRTAYGTIAHVRNDYNLRRSIERMIRNRQK